MGELKIGGIPFLDALISHTVDGKVKVQVYQKATNTDQYLNSSCHHPLNHKLDVIHTLCMTVVTTLSQSKRML